MRNYAELIAASWPGLNSLLAGVKQKTVGVDFSTPTGTFRDVGLGAPLGGRPLEAAKDLEPGATY